METEELSLTTSIGNIRISKDGAVIPENLSYTEWFEQVRGMRMVKELYHAALSDLVKYGRRHYGKESVDAAMHQLHFDLSDVYRANALVELENGLKIRPELSADHRYVIGKELADDPAKQEEWANVSIKEGLTPAELRMSIQRGTLVKGLRNERSPGIITFESVFMQFQRAVRQYGGVESIRKMEGAERERIADLLEPVTEFISQIKE